MTRHSQTAALAWLIRRDVTLAWRRQSDVLATLFFFLMVVTLVTLSVGPETELLRQIAPGVVWVAALLASMLSLGRLFADDHADGTLEQLLLTPLPLALVVSAKVLAQWLVSMLPLLVMTPIAGVQLGLSLDAPLVLMWSLIVGAPIILLVGSVGAALTLGLRGSGSLTPLLVMPLCIPTLIFGASAVQAATGDGSASGNLRLLAAMFILAVSFAPWVTAAALRISLE